MLFKPEGILRKLKNCHFSQFWINVGFRFDDEYDDTLRKFFLNDITTKYIIATDLVLRRRSSIHESEFIKRLLLMSLSNEAVHQPQLSAVGIHLKSFLMKLMNWQPNEKSLSQISKSPHHITQWGKILRFKSHQRQNIQKSDFRSPQ